MSIVPAPKPDNTRVKEFVTKPAHAYLPLLQAARSLFQPDQLQRLLPSTRSFPLQDKDIHPELKTEAKKFSPTAAGLPDSIYLLLQDPIAATQALAHDYLAKGGKYSRPFIALAAYDALTGTQAENTHDAASSQDQSLPHLPDAVYRVALSIETFHKASLVHDDIEDDDEYRYGEPTLHRALGLPMAINVGDYLIGLGYRLVSREMEALGPEVAGEILDYLADAHLRLSEGQGAELLWRDAGNKQLTPQDAIDIYALKTAPAFEAALLCGLRCATPLGNLERPLKQLANHLGIAFQILNDLKDWQGDQDNKLLTGLDTLGGRPTLLWALALEGLDTQSRTELLQMNDPSSLAGSPTSPPSSNQDAQRLARVKQLYQQADVFHQAGKLVEKYQKQAEAIADAVEPIRLRQLLYFLIDTMLNQPSRVSTESCLPTDFS